MDQNDRQHHKFCVIHPQCVGLEGKTSDARYPPAKDSFILAIDHRREHRILAYLLVRGHQRLGKHTVSAYRRYLVLGSAVLGLLMLLSACAGSGEGLDEPDDSIIVPPPVEVEAPTFSDIQTMILTPICVCHVGAAAPLGLVLDTDDSINILVNIPSAEVPDLFRVEPGNPDDSYLVRKLEGGPDIVGGQMPLGGPPLSQDMIDMVREWIIAGALDN